MKFSQFLVIHVFLLRDLINKIITVQIQNAKLLFMKFSQFLFIHVFLLHDLINKIIIVQAQIVKILLIKFSQFPCHFLFSSCLIT
jgi:hypothetical protein